MRGGDFVVLTRRAGTVRMSGTEQGCIAEEISRVHLSVGCMKIARWSVQAYSGGKGFRANWLHVS